MRVMELTDWGLEHLRLGHRPDPVPGPRELVLKMAAASVNFRDSVVPRRGYGRLSGELPLIPLSDGAGHVVALGRDATRFALGDLVMPIVMPGWHAGPLAPAHRHALLGGPRDGVLQELMAVDEDDVVAAPSFYSALEAAALPCAAVTAWCALADLRPGATVVIEGTGGVALFALQFARIKGATAILTSGDEAKRARALAMGAAAAIDYRAEPEWSRAVRRIAPDGADLVIELGGAATLAEALRAVRVGGTVALIGVLSGATAALELGRVVTQALRLQGVTLGSRDDFAAMVRAIELHRLRPVLDDPVYGFEDAAAAIAAITQGRHFGKIAIAFQ